MNLGPSRTIAAIALLAMVPGFLGCWSFQTGPKRFEFAEATPSRASAKAILRVNEAGIPWGNGEIGPAIREALLSRGVFREVYYPVEPIDPPTTVVEVIGLGDADEAVAWALIAAAPVGGLRKSRPPSARKGAEIGAGREIPRVGRRALLKHHESWDVSSAG